jgi:hypothetical protein
MTNSATRRTALTLDLGGSFYGFSAIPILLNYDTPGGDLLISQPPVGQSIFLIGMECVNGLASKPVFKSEATALVRYELSANSGRVESLCPSDPRILCNTEPGEGLHFSCDVALPPLLLYIVEA